jgi:hypothetical protein
MSSADERQRRWARWQVLRKKNPFALDIWLRYLIAFHPGAVMVAIGIAGALLLLVSILSPAPATAPSLATSTAYAPASAAPPTAPPIPVAPTEIAADELGRMLADADVLDASGAVIARVHAGRSTHIIGLDGAATKIRMHDGTEGFVPADRVADVGAWLAPD